MDKLGKKKRISPEVKAARKFQRDTAAEIAREERQRLLNYATDDELQALNRSADELGHGRRTRRLLSRLRLRAAAS